MEFRWNEWNLDHVTQHGIDPLDAEMAILRARGPYPQIIGDDKFLVWGQGRGERLLQVIYTVGDDGRLYVIHARDLTAREKRLWRRRMR